MNNICIITARGGSKRIPKKNIKNFCGKPIIAYSIEAAIKSELFDEVMVSTDSEEIANVARQYGAVVPFMRSEKNSDDYAGTEDVIQEVLLEYKKKQQYFDVACCIYPTAALLKVETLLEAYGKLLKDNVDAVEPVVAFSYPPQRCYILRNGLLDFNWKEYKQCRSQDLELLYHDAGQFYFWKVDAFEGYMNGEKTMRIAPIIMMEEEVQDIDNMSDWLMAEMKYKMRSGATL